MHDPVPQVIAVCTSRGGIPKISRPSAFMTFKGLYGDGHNHAKHNTPLQAVSFQDEEILEDLRSEGFPVTAGVTGENLTVRHLNINRLSVGTVLEFSGGVVVQLTKMRTPCYVLDSIDPALKDAILGRCGFYGKVLREGLITTGETINIRILHETAN